jgi:selenide,water dikinase
LTKAGAQPGDSIYLTKPLGTGVVTTAQKKDTAEEQDLRTAVDSMARLHAGAASILERFEGVVHAATDVTGFGLAGHGHEVAKQSGLCLRLEWDRLWLLPGAERYAKAGLACGGTGRNRAYYEKWLRFSNEFEEWKMALLYDPQTAGGLFLAVDPARGKALERAFENANEPLRRIGEAATGDSGVIEFV